MRALPLQKFHLGLGAQFMDLSGEEVVAHYGDARREHALLRDAAGVLDLSFRGRLCLTGTDRQRFLNGQVTNNVSELKPGEGCYAALITAKGKLVSDLNIHRLENEILLDFEPGLTEVVIARLEKHIIADDVQVVNAAPHHGLLSVQGPKAEMVIRQSGVGLEPPGEAMRCSSRNDATLGEIYLMNQPRFGTTGFDLFIPVAGLEPLAENLLAAAKSIGGGACGWQALEMVRIEAGIPRFGADMDDSNLPPEAGLEARAISYTKGCYIGQEVIARVRTYGQVAKMLRGLRLADELKTLPRKGDKLWRDGKEVGFITSALDSPTCQAKIALGYVRREANRIGAMVQVRTDGQESEARIVELPFRFDAGLPR